MLNLMHHDAGWQETYEGTEYPRNANGFWFEELGVTVLGHGGNTKAFSSNLLIDPISKTSVVSMTNQSDEEIYNIEMMPLTFGEFKPDSSDIIQTKEGIHGKLSTVFTRVKLKDNNQIELTWPGNSFDGYEFEPTLYNLEGSLFQIYKDNDESTIISTAYQDFYKLKTSQIIIEYTLIILAIIALLLC